MSGFSTLDIVAVAVFALAWLLYGWIIENSRWRTRTLTHAMNQQRRAWIDQLAERELRMIDTGIMTGLQNGTAFFASTSLLAVGGAFAAINASDRVVEIARDLPLGLSVSRAAWETKAVGLILIYAYAFFKFGWSYRLFNYASILIGAIPNRQRMGTPEMEAAVKRTAAMVVIAGSQFNQGLRAFFMSVGYLGWFVGPVPFLISSAVVLTVLARRQFFSPSRAAVAVPNP
ncbi:DUF599 domain-containing protein [Chthonobacter rhizosphaerae]|uniref:DUF599 domain-containing protein n=1 Tax=Chthonobacter rhizosphaerae TaxID=2735553 RepID=UPI0015EE58DF|nr:DUF599 family protein [Chthonobacter rhizosphaerae]